MKYIFTLLMLLAFTLKSSADGVVLHGITSGSGCPISSDESLVCAVVLCNPLGFMVPESVDECFKVNAKFAIYLATLGFWDSPPKCRFRDQFCNKIGKANTAYIKDDFCEKSGLEGDALGTCLTALGSPPDGFCETRATAELQEKCAEMAALGEINKAKYGSNDLCDTLDGWSKIMCFEKIKNPSFHVNPASLDLGP